MFVPTLAAVEVLKTELSIPGPHEPGPFSLAEVERVSEVLDQAGFTDISAEHINGSRLITSGTAGDNVAAFKVMARRP